MRLRGKGRGGGVNNGVGLEEPRHTEGACVVLKLLEDAEWRV